MSIDEITEAQQAAEDAKLTFEEAKQKLKDAEEEARQAARDVKKAEEDALEQERPPDLGRLEVVHIYDEDRGVYSYRLPFKILADNLPITCRVVPDYAALRKGGLAFGAGIALVALFFSIVVGVKFDATIGGYSALMSIILLPLLAFFGWDVAPTFPLHDYRPFWIVRKVLAKEEDDPISDWYEPTNWGLRRYLVPFAHSFLNLRSIQEEKEDAEYTPFVMRATTAYQDASMVEEKRIITSNNTNKWEKIKAASLIGLIFAELVAVFFLFIVSME